MLQDKHIVPIITQGRTWYCCPRERKTV